MTDERVEEVLFDINGKLSSIETKLDSMSENILKHEARLTTLETSFNKHLAEIGNCKDGDYKIELLRLLGKCLVIALTSLTTLIGGGSLLVKVLGIAS